MNNKRAVERDKAELNELKLLIETYAEIAAIRMQRVRSGVLANRDYLTDVEKIYQEVRENYKAEVADLIRRRRLGTMKKFSLIKRNGKSANVFIAANTGLYGDIVKRTFDEFAKSLRKTGNDAVILGKIGSQLYTEAKLTNQVAYFDFPDDYIDAESLAKVITSIIQYERVQVFYEKFENAVFQQPAVSDLTGEQVEGTAPQEKVKYLFEPSLEDIMLFFETEIFASLFSQALQEAQLAKFASRMVNLDASTERIKTKLKAVWLDEQRLRHAAINNKLLNSIAGIALWQKVRSNG